MFALLGFALIGGSNPLFANPAQSAAPMTMTNMPCDMAMPMTGAEHEKPTQPCNGIAPDGIKHMCCVTMSVLPADFQSRATTVEYSVVGYWASVSKLAGVEREPEHLPPRTT